MKEKSRKFGGEHKKMVFRIRVNFQYFRKLKTGGKIRMDWWRFNKREIKQQIINLKIGEITKPIVVPGGFLILKLRIHSLENKIDINTELEKGIVFLQNTQLNQFSNIYFTKLKRTFN